MGKGSGKSQARLDARSPSMNPQDAVGQAAIANRGVQLNPTSTLYNSSRGQPTASIEGASEQSKE
jgi:hypothetical protein